ncbi:MAG TPA: ABC transporter substrate-binding protein [Dongiaceae bacterium]|jgi:putative thiamine transport system substrate-binding protein|nr:ABC transporter substrate-binding protein [Dongiaceae bacterium]
MKFARRTVLLGTLALGGTARMFRAHGETRLDWAATLKKARGQEVFFNAWAGDERINAYIAWAADELSKRHGIGLHHVKLGATAEAVSRILAEKAVGQARGSVDLLWLNGENFAALKGRDLLYGPFLESVPSARYIDAANPTFTADFTVPIEGYEAPWGLAQLVFFRASRRVPESPDSLAKIAAWAAAHPGRFTYPAPPDFHGTTFLKQVLLDSYEDRTLFSRPADPAQFPAHTQKLWDYLDTLHPHLWRQGKNFPKDSAQHRQLVADGEADIYFAFNPADASSAIAQKLLPPTIVPFTLQGGTIANAHFLAIPANASSKEGALVAVDFLMSPEAQRRKQDPRIWGDPTILDEARLPAAERDAFTALPLGPATPRAEALGAKLAEPHPSWVMLLQQGWAKRYAA